MIYVPVQFVANTNHAIQNIIYIKQYKTFFFSRNTLPQRFVLVFYFFFFLAFLYMAFWFYIASEKKKRKKIKSSLVVVFPEIR